MSEKNAEFENCLMDMCVLMITPVGPAQWAQMNATREEELLGKLKQHLRMSPIPQ